jgi:hypothetical protein
LAENLGLAVVATEVLLMRLGFRELQTQVVVEAVVAILEL